MLCDQKGTRIQLEAELEDPVLIETFCSFEEFHKFQLAEAIDSVLLVVFVLNLNAGREHISWCQPSNTENLSSPSTNSWKKISENDPKKRNDYEMGLSWKATGRGGMGEKRK